MQSPNEHAQFELKVLFKFIVVAIVVLAANLPAELLVCGWLNGWCASGLVSFPGKYGNSSRGFKWYQVWFHQAGGEENKSVLFLEMNVCWLNLNFFSFAVQRNTEFVQFWHF